MLKIDIIQDEDLQGVVKKFISALLPHESYDSSFFVATLQTLFKYVHLDEFEMEYYLLLKALNDLGQLKISFLDFEPKLTSENLESLLEASIMDVIMRPELGIKEWLEYEGMDSNLKNEVVKESACQKVCQRCLELYSDCFDLAIPSAEVMNYRPELAAALKSNASIQSINTQVAMIRGSVRIGRKEYSGVDDWLQYNSRATEDLIGRLKIANDENTTVLNSLAVSDRLLKNLNTTADKISNWGIPSVDDYTPILRHRLVTVCGAENTGKTMYAIHVTTNVLLDGGTVVYMCGETTQSKVYCMILISYIWKKYGLILEPEHLRNPQDCPEEVQKIISMSIVEILDNNKLILQDSFSYHTMDAELRALYSQTPFDVVVIDHTCALKGAYGDGSLYSNVSQLAEVTLNFKKEFPVCVLLLSHLSTNGKDAVHKNKDTRDSMTKGSGDVSANSDEVFLLESNDTLLKQNLIKFRNLKRRDAPVLTNPVYLDTMFKVAGFMYDESKQASDNISTLAAEEALAALQDDCKDAEYSLY